MITFSIGSAFAASCTKGQAMKIVLASAGLAADSFDLFVIDLVKLMMSELYPQTVRQSAAVSMAALIGAVVGQVFWGFTGDTIGRTRSFVLTALLVTIGALGSASAFSSPHALNIYTQLAIWRGLLGFGIGGEYPLTASITAGGAKPNLRSVAIVFASQGVGRLLACFTNWAVLAIGLPLDICWRVSLGVGALPTLLTFWWRWKLMEASSDEESSEPPALLDETGGGARSGSDGTVSSPPQASKGAHGSPSPRRRDQADTLPPATEDDSRAAAGGDRGSSALHQHEEDEEAALLGRRADDRSPGSGTPALTLDDSVPPLGGDAAVTQQQQQHRRGCCTVAGSRFRNVLRTLRPHWWLLVGAAGCWLILDVAFYSQTLFSGTIVNVIGVGGSAAGPKSRAQLLQIAVGSLVLVSIAFPGYVAGVVAIEWIGTFNLQLYGFGLLSGLFLLLAASFVALKKANLVSVAVVFYALTFFFSDCGPNLTTFLIPVEVFPVSVRATAHGIAAAAGKLGAIVGTYSLPHILNSKGSSEQAKDVGLTLVLYLCAGLSAAGALWTAVFLHRGRMPWIDAGLRWIGRLCCVPGAPTGAGEEKAHADCWSARPEHSDDSARGQQAQPHGVDGEHKSGLPA